MLRRRHLFMHPLPIIHPTIHQPKIHLWIHPPIIHESMHPHIYLFIYPSSRYPFAQTSTHPSIYPFVHSSIYPFIHPSIFIQISTHLIIHLRIIYESTLHPNCPSVHVFVHYLLCPPLLDTVMCCPDPLAMKNFWSQLLGGLVSKSL